MKVLIATEKPFAKRAVDGIKEIFDAAGYQVVMLEKYTDKAELIAAVADVDAMIVRSDKVTADVLAAANQLKIVGKILSKDCLVWPVSFAQFLFNKAKILKSFATQQVSYASSLD